MPPRVLQLKIGHFSYSLIWKLGEHNVAFLFYSCCEHLFNVGLFMNVQTQWKWEWFTLKSTTRLYEPLFIFILRYISILMYWPLYIKLAKKVWRWGLFYYDYCARMYRFFIKINIKGIVTQKNVEVLHKVQSTHLWMLLWALGCVEVHYVWEFFRFVKQYSKTSELRRKYPTLNVITTSHSARFLSSSAPVFC